MESPRQSAWQLITFEILISNLDSGGCIMDKSYIERLWKRKTYSEIKLSLNISLYIIFGNFIST